MHTMYTEKYNHAQHTFIHTHTKHIALTYISAMEQKKRGKNKQCSIAYDVWMN